MEVAPGQHRARVLEVEEHAVAAAGQEDRERGSVSKCWRADQWWSSTTTLLRDLAEIAQLRVRQRDVREHHEVALVRERVEGVVVAARDGDAALAPGAPGGVGGAEAVGAAGVVVADARHAPSVARQREIVAA